jgi:pyridoxamine 5'-phosphate oxidase
MKKMAIFEIRQSYQQGILSEDSADPNPFQQFGHWLDEALQMNFREPNAMALATSMPDDTPSVLGYNSE